MILFKLAWRNLWRNSRRTWITTFSVVFAILLALFMESMERGSQELMVQNMVRFSTGYIQVQDTLYKEEISLDNSMFFDTGLQQQLETEVGGVAFTVPRMESFALAAGEVKSRVAYVMGIDPESEHQFNDIKTRLAEGVFFDEGDSQAVVSAGLAKNLQLNIGDTLVLFGQGFQGATAAGKFVVKGTFRHPVPEMNETIVYLKLEDAQWLFSAYDRLTSLLIMPERPGKHQRLAHRLKNEDLLESYKVYTWEELQPELVRTVAFDRATTFIYLMILYIVVGFGIFGTVLTMVLEREKEFGMLISVGMHRRKLSFVILTETLIINFMGVVLGMVLALPFLIYLYYNPIPLGEDLGALMADYGMEALLTFSLDPHLFLQQGIIIFCISMLIVLYPISRILTLNVLNASRK